MTATNNRMFERLDEIGYFHLNKFHKLSLQICVIWKYFGIVCPVLFESVQNWTTQRFTITKKLNILKQTVSKKIMTRPANNGCRKDSFVPHAIIKRDFGGSTRDVTGKMAPFKMANVSNLEELLQSENGLLRINEWYLWCTWYIY